MQRTIGRAYQRLKGNHPRRPEGFGHRVMEIFCDVLLGFGALAIPIGIGLVVWGCLTGFDLARIGIGAALVVVGPLALLAWEHLAWEPFEERLSQLS